MMGRAAYQEPWRLLAVDPTLFGSLRRSPGQRRQPRPRPYIERELARGTRLNAITRHVLGLFRGVPGARAFRRHLAAKAVKPGAGAETFHAALALIVDIDAPPVRFCPPRLRVSGEVDAQMIFGVPMSELSLLAALIIIAGVLTGFLAGLFGIGGGALIVPVLYEVFRVLGVSDDVRFQLCVGTSIAIIVPTNLLSLRVHRDKGAVLTEVVRQWTVPAVVGVAVGAASRVRARCRAQDRLRAGGERRRVEAPQRPRQLAARRPPTGGESGESAAAPP